MVKGDLVRFTGSWGQTVTPGERSTGVIVKTWHCGITRRVQSADVFWDNGDCTATMSSLLKVVNENR